MPEVRPHRNPAGVVLGDVPYSKAWRRRLWRALPLYRDEDRRRAKLLSSEATTIQTRECLRCHYTLPIQDFHRSQGTGRRGGYHSWCKECHSEYSAERYAEQTGREAKKRMGATPQKLLADEEVARLNRKHYREREGKACAFVGCQTRVRYRSPYKPYCQLHGTKDKRERALS